MKKACLILLAICLVGMACEKEKVLECKLCLDFDTVGILNDEKVKIIKTEFPNDGVDSFFIALEIMHNGLMPTIVPCNILPEMYRKDGLEVRVSGIVTDCFVRMHEADPFAKYTPSNVFILTKIE